MKLPSSSELRDDSIKLQFRSFHIMQFVTDVLDIVIQPTTSCVTEMSICRSRTSERVFMYLRDLFVPSGEQVNRLYTFYPVFYNKMLE